MTIEEWEWESLYEPGRPRETLPRAMGHWNRTRRKEERAAAKARYQARKAEYEEFVEEVCSPASPESVFGGEQLFKQYECLARKIARDVLRELKLSRYLRYWREHLYQAADLGLWDAIRRYDSRPRSNGGKGPPQVISLAHYAQMRIRGEVIDAIRHECLAEQSGGNGPAEIDRQIVARARRVRGEVGVCGADALTEGPGRLPDRATRSRDSEMDVVEDGLL
jgi:hypothetical protein